MTLTLPGLLNRLADEEEERARAQQAATPRQADCDICGLVESGCFGFGVFRNRRGVWACKDLDCCAEAKARAAESHRQLVAAE